MAKFGSEMAELGLEMANLGSIMAELGRIGPVYELRTEAIRFEPLKKMQVKTHLFLGCFRSFWDSDGGLLGHRCAMWPPCRFGLGSNLGPQGRDLNHCKRCVRKWVYIGDVLGHFGALIRTLRVTAVRPGLPGCT